MGNDNGNDGDPQQDPFRTQRLQTVSGLNPAFTPGEFVYLVATMPGFSAGTRFKVVAARATGPGLYTYELLAGDRTVWVKQGDVRGTAPDNAADAPPRSGPNRAFSMTQRMQTMTLSQRLSALGIGQVGELGSTQRLRALNLGDSLKRQAAAPPAPETDGPVTGAPPFRDADDPPK